MAAPALIPDAATYGTEQAQAQQSYDKAKANIQTQQLGFLKQYGMTADPTGSGGYSNYRIDPYNQYGLIQQNKTSEAQDLNLARDDSINRGIGSGGLANQGASMLHYQHGVQDTNLGNTFAQGMGGFAQNLNDASSTYQSQLYQAQADAIQRALANSEFEQYNQPPDSGGGDGSGDGSGSGSGGNSSAVIDWVRTLGLGGRTYNDPQQQSDRPGATAVGGPKTTAARKKAAATIAAGARRVAG